MNNPFPIHVRTVTGLEPILAEELNQLGALNIHPQNRLVTCEGGQRLLYRLNVFCRTAIRVLRPLATFTAKDEKSFYEGLRSIDWKQWLAPEGALAIDANVHSAFTTHSLFVAQLTKDAIVDQFRERTGKRPSVDLEKPDLRIAVSLFQDTAQIYLDSSGESLHKRGYRRKAGEAPLNEALAAGIIKLSGWDGSTPLLDPMCGSGTLLIEAGLILKNIAPGLLRQQFGFQRWPNFNRVLFESVLSEARNAISKDHSGGQLIGLDINPDVVDIARGNVERAGLTGLIRIEKGDFFTRSSLSETAGTLVMNPPYDERLPVDNVASLYQKIGDQLKVAYAGWTAFVLSGNLDAVKYIGLRSSRRVILFNGAIECRLLKFELRESTGVAPMRRPQPAPEANPKWKEKSEVLANRLRKNQKHFSKWAKREGITCWRVYDRDIPELPFIIDVYGDRLHFAEVERNHDHSPIEHIGYMQLMVKTASEVLGIPQGKVYFKKRKPQKAGGFQYTPHAATGEYIEVTEGGHRFLANLSDYLDVGLFLDHRKTRALIEKEASGKDFLNLFAYTGSFSVYAAAGGAKSTTTVDTAHSYLEWAEKNLKLNGFSGPQHRFIRSDAVGFLENTPARFDLCVVDPPTRSVNRSSGRLFEVQADHVRLLHLVLDKMRPGGKVYFSTNYRTFQLDEAALKKGRPLRIKEITAQTIPLDFGKKPSHRCWIIERTTPATDFAGIKPRTKVSEVNHSETKH